MHECKIELSLEVWWAYANLFKALELAMFIFLFAHLFSIRLANINFRYFTLKTKFQFDTCSFTTNRPEGWARSIFF